MRKLMFVVASTFAMHLLACGGGDTNGPGPSGTSSSGAGQGGGATSSGGSTGGGGTTSGGASSSGATPESKCTPLIGNWTATIDPGAFATGTDTTLVGNVPITGNIDFSLTHDDADLPDIVDFNGTATIQAAGQTVVEKIQPQQSPSGDAKDTKCDGGLHLNGAANIPGVGDIVFTIDGTLDTTTSPTKGQGSFTMKTANDNGAAITANGTVHMTKK